MVDLPGPSAVRSIAASQPRSGLATANGVYRGAGKAGASNSEPQTVSVARDLASEPAPVDQARVAQIRAAISAGTYTIEPHKIARALLRNT